MRHDDGADLPLSPQGRICGACDQLSDEFLRRLRRLLYARSHGSPQGHFRGQRHCTGSVPWILSVKNLSRLRELSPGWHACKYKKHKLRQR